MEVLEHLLIDVEQIDLLIGGLYERSIESCAEVVGVKHQQIFVDGEVLLSFANHDGDKSASEVLASGRKDQNRVLRQARRMTYLEGVLLGIETAPLDGVIAVCDCFERVTMVADRGGPGDLRFMQSVLVQGRV
jgi:hypothetical protein